MSALAEKRSRLREAWCWLYPLPCSSLHWLGPFIKLVMGSGLCCRPQQMIRVRLHSQVFFPPSVRRICVFYYFLGKQQLNDAHANLSVGLPRSQPTSGDPSSLIWHHQMLIFSWTTQFLFYKTCVLSYCRNIVEPSWGCNLDNLLIYNLITKPGNF